MGWEWDESLYAGSAAYYPVGRLPYPAEVADALSDAMGLDGSGRLLDVGCGPGSLTLLLAPLFVESVGIDADPDMIAVAGQAASRAGVGNVRWRQLRAEDLPAGLGTFRLVSFAQSFHWTDRPRVAQLVRVMLEPNGAVVLVQATTHQGVPGEDPLPHPRPPRTEIAALVAAFLGSIRRAGRGSLPAGTPSGEDVVLRDAGFQGPDRVEVGGGRVWTRTEDEVVASVFSLSSAAPHLFGDRLTSFEADLRDLLHRYAPDGMFAERSREIALDLWRPA
ncbi:MAG: class I SAM-dependent methyltransferase [Geodermatophilaceae bacterium]|nr:class I SAM-dependent methyltransferase [Geodermatophilaceae bacterium]